MSEFTAELLDAYLDDALPESDSARVEQALRDSAELRARLKAVIDGRDRGEHSLGAVWRRERLSCPSRDQLGTYLLGALEPDWQEYLEFHLAVVACPFCLANLADLKSRRAEPAPQANARKRRYFESSAGLLRRPPAP
jgi:hypothetical protein